MIYPIHCIPHDRAQPEDPASHALDAFADQIPEHIASLSIAHDDNGGDDGSARLVLFYGIDARRLAEDANAARDVLNFLEKVSSGIHAAVGLAPTCVPVKLLAIG